MRRQSEVISNGWSFMTFFPANFASVCYCRHGHVISWLSFIIVVITFLTECKAVPPYTGDAGKSQTPFSTPQRFLSAFREPKGAQHGDTGAPRRNLTSYASTAPKIPESVPSHSKHRLAALREIMSSRGLDAYIVYTGDPHGTEVPAEHDNRRAYLSEFTGTFGTALVTKDEAFLWTDARYFTQAASQLDGTAWRLMKQGVSGTPDIAAFIDSQTSVKKLGVDSFTTPLNEYSRLKRISRVISGDLRLVLLDENLIDRIWGVSQPTRSQNPIVIHPASVAGVSAQKKLRTLRKEMTNNGCYALLLTCLSEIAWTLNLRGSDLPHDPVFFSYLLISEEQTTLFADAYRLTEEASDHLKAASITVLDYDKLLEHLDRVVSAMNEQGKSSLTFWINGKTNLAIYNFLKSRYISTLVARTPVAWLKVKKNEAELSGMREAHIREGVAYTTFLFEVDELLRSGQIFKETECTLRDRLDGLRAAQTGFRGTSFRTISAIGPNSAIIHYRPEVPTCHAITPEMYLVDSGGQYDCGTTDATRTIHFGTPTQYHKECWTRVLKGLASFCKSIFPRRVAAPHLEALARLPLWAAGSDYQHATGHSIGACLSLHEGPFSISDALNGDAAGMVMEEGLITSVEPGHYRENEFGIRIENAVEVALYDSLPSGIDRDEYLTFRPLTMIPLSKKMMDLKLMTIEEIDWVNTYHSVVEHTLSPRIAAEAGSRALELLAWLRDATSPILP